jgi:hypothetical protein
MKAQSALLLVGLSVYAGSAPADPPAQFEVVQRTEDLNVPYDARFVFARLRYESSSDPSFGLRGGGFNRQPPWQHDYPQAERNLMHIVSEVTTMRPYVDGGNIVDVGSPELMKFPIAYMSEPGFWTMTDREAENLRNYVVKGGFLIFDDFGGAQWQNFALQMQRVLPAARIVRLEASHPIFHSFFEIDSLDDLHPGYRGIPLFFGIHEDNDPAKRLLAIVNYNNDIGENWEYSDTGFVPVDVSNEAYQFGVNYIVYALTH